MSNATILVLGLVALVIVALIQWYMNTGPYDKKKGR